MRAARAVWLAAAGLAAAVVGTQSLQAASADVTRARLADAAGPPATWIAVRRTRDAFLVERSSEEGGRPRVLARIPRPAGPEAGSGLVTDVALDARAGVVLVAVCCEPASGHVLAVRLRGRPATEDYLQGHRIDAAGVGATLARADTFGVAGVVAGFPASADSLTATNAAVADVAVSGDGKTVAALVDRARVRRFAPGARGPSARGVRIWRRGAAGWTSSFVRLPGRYCSLVFLGGEAIGLVTEAKPARDPLGCLGASLDVLHPGTGEIRRGALRFSAPVQHVSADRTGEHLLLVSAAGTVEWLGPDGRRGVLDRRGGIVAADW
jgi:hypothetical protein